MVSKELYSKQEDSDISWGLLIEFVFKDQTSSESKAEQRSLQEIKAVNKYESEN